MIPLLTILYIVGSTFGNPISTMAERPGLITQNCPCYNLMTCLDSELNALSFGVSTYKGYQSYYNNTINNVLTNIENKLNLSKYRFPPTKRYFNVPLCMFPESQTNEVYKNKVRYLNTMDSDFVTTKKRYEDLFSIYSIRLMRILNRLNVTDDES